MTKTKTTHANSPSLWTSRGWDTLRSARAQMKLWFLDAFPSLSPPPPRAVHVPCPGGSTAPIQDCVTARGSSVCPGWHTLAGQVRLQRPGVYHQCWDKSAPLDDNTFVDILTWTQQQHWPFQENIAVRTWSVRIRRSNLQHCDTTDLRVRVVSWYGRNGHHALIVINMGPFKRGAGWGRWNLGPEQNKSHQEHRRAWMMVWLLGFY